MLSIRLERAVAKKQNARQAAREVAVTPARNSLNESKRALQDSLVQQDFHSGLPGYVTNKTQFDGAVFDGSICPQTVTVHYLIQDLPPTAIPASTGLISIFWSD